jgi:hypothetical protein
LQVPWINEITGWARLQNIHNKWAARKFAYINNLAPTVEFEQFWDLTSEFWVVFEENSCK